MRGGKAVVIEDRIEIGTSSLHSVVRSTIVLELYDGNWHCFHNYETSSKTGGYAGHETTKEVLKYLREEKQQIFNKKTRLDTVESNLEETIKKLEE